MSPEEFIRDVLHLEGGTLTSGWYRTCCPIHGESRPSFGIKLDYPFIYNCFACPARGNIVDLTQKLLKISAKQAKSLVEDSIQVTLNPVEEWEKHEPDPVADLWVEILQEQLSNSRGIRYCRGRGVPKYALSNYRVGYDKSSLRLMVPLSSVENPSKTLGFETRGFLAAGIEKYTDIKEGWKNKVMVLPKGSLDKPGIIIVEGVFDVFRVYMWLLKVGKLHKYIVAGLSGKIVSKQRVNFVSGYSNICLGFDKDSAGYSARLKWAQTLSNVPLQRLIFNGDDPGASDRFKIETLI